MPYYFNLSPHKDLTLEPIFTTSEGAVLGGTYRQHTGNGQFNISGSLARVNIRDDNSTLTGQHGIRGHIGSMGKFDLPKINVFSANWQWDYKLKWVSSDTYLRRYYADKSDVIQSHAKIEAFWDRSYATAGIYGFQGLKAEDDFGQTAQALPSFDISTVGDAGFLNSKITFNANGAYIYRRAGLRTGRVSLQSGWELPFSSPFGDFYKITATVRTDFYHNRSSGVTQKPQFSGRNGTYIKFRPRIALDWRMPFINTSSADSQHVLEPMVSIILSPNQANPDFIPNEDSRNFEFDENNLFSHNRFNGYDRWESGIRINYGLRYNYFAPDITLRATLGQSVRLSNTKQTIRGTTNDFPIGSGYEGQTSDFVGRFDLSIGDNLDFIYRFRLDTKSLALKRNEMIVSGKLGFVKASVRYLNLDLSGTQLENRREIGAGLKLDISENLTLHGNFVHDLLNDDTITYDAGIIYKTDCLEFGVRYEQRFTTDRDITPSNALLFSLVLKNLG
jgi:LPS-assembly protein